MFRAHVLIIIRSKLHYTASGIITPIGGRLVHLCTRRPPLHVSSTKKKHTYTNEGLLTLGILQSVVQPVHLTAKTVRGTKNTDTQFQWIILYKPFFQNNYK